MIDLKKIFEDKKNEFQTDKILIKVVSLAEIQDIKKGVFNGCFNPVIIDENYARFEILIDKTLNYNEKISVLFHEMGHQKLYESLGFTKIHAQRTKNKDGWQANSEFNAFKNQLEEGKMLFENGVTSVLSIIVKSINETHKNPTIETAYVEAIERIYESDIWKECNKLIGKGI